MKAMRLCWFLFLFVFIPSPLIGRSDYSTLDPDSLEVQQACEVAVKKLGPDRGAVAIEKTVVEIIGIPKGVAGSGVAVTGHVAGVETALNDLGTKVTETEIRIELPGDILFDFDKYDIRPDAQEALGKVAVVIRAYPGKDVLIEGHTDSKGSEGYNLKLSFSRAESVKRWLQEKEDLRDTNGRDQGMGGEQAKSHERD